MKTKIDNKLIDVNLEAFNFWECSYIGINIMNTETNTYVGGYDLRLEEAKKLVGQLQMAISTYEDMESSYQDMESK